MAQILDQTLVRLRQSTHVRTLVEVALVRLCKLEDLDALPGLVAQLRDGTPLPRRQRPRSRQPSRADSVPPTTAATASTLAASRSKKNA